MIEEYEFGRIVVNGKVYFSDVIIHPDGVEEGWWREEGHRVTMRDIDIIVQLNPEAVVFGNGTSRRVRVDREVRKYFESRGVDVFEDDSHSAVKIFESLIRSGKRAVLAIHLTC